MNEYITITKQQDSISLTLNVEDCVIIELGEKINDICDEAYMNGYNWEVLINYYIENNCNNLLDGMHFDSEAGSFVIYYENTKENELKINEIRDTINFFVQNQDDLIAFVKENESEIPWD